MVFGLQISLRNHNVTGIIINNINIVKKAIVFISRRGRSSSTRLDILIIPVTDNVVPPSNPASFFALLLCTFHIAYGLGIIIVPFNPTRTPVRLPPEKFLQNARTQSTTTITTPSNAPFLGFGFVRTAHSILTINLSNALFASVRLR